MDQSNSAGRAGSNVRMRLFQPRGNDNPGDDEVQSRQSNRNDMQANGYDVRNNSEVELQLSDSELVPEDSGRESTVDGVESASISLLPLAQVRSPVDESNILESNVQGSEQHLDGAMVVAESFSGNDTSELDIDSGRLAEAAALIRSSPGGFADERDPNYATQRPDTLGAITIAEVTQGAATGGMQSRYTGAPSTLRSWMADSAVEGASFADNSSSAPRLGRRTRGAGMDQVELNQRYLLDDDDDNDDDDGNQSENDEENSDGDTGSDLGDEDDDDNRLRNANQCESTEADQYKMEPEVDQSDGIELSGRTPPLSAGNHQEVDAALPNGLAQNDLDHVNRLDRFGHDNVCGDARDVDKAEEDQNPSARQLLSSAHQSRAVHVSHLGASSSVHEPDGASRKCTVSQQQHSQTVSASTVKIGASVAKTCPIGAAGCGGSKLGVGGSSDVTASAFKPVTSARAVSSHEASVIPGQQSKVAGKQVLTMNLAAARHGNLQHAVATTNRQGVQVQPPVKQNSAVPVHKLPNEFSTSSVTMSDPMVINESYTDQHDPELASHEARMQKRTGIPPVGADLRQSYLGPIASRDDDVRSSRDKYEGSGPDLRLDTQNAFVDIADYTLANSGRNAAARAPPVAGARESPAAIGSFIPGDSSSQQATPVRIYTHLPHQLLDDSLEMSPIRPASSAGSQHTSLHALETASVRGDHLNGLDFVPFRSCGHQVSVLRFFCKLHNLCVGFID
jgi:hypothetical protein